MVRAQGDGEYWGAIAGQAEGDLAGNRYLMEDLAGLDGVDYAELAQGLDFDAFRQLDYLPEDFLTFSYRFTVNGSLLAEVPFDYGGDLDRSPDSRSPGAERAVRPVALLPDQGSPPLHGAGGGI